MNSMDDEIASLNYDCNYNLYLAKRLVSDIKKLRDRQCAVKWLRFIMSSSENIAEMQLRNDFMYYLVLSLQQGCLRPPFNSLPPNTGTLKDVAHLIPDQSEYMDDADVLTDLEDSDKELPMIMSKSPDEGAFLALQPIPNEGSFCYLAITTKRKEE